MFICQFAKCKHVFLILEKFLLKINSSSRKKYIHLSSSIGSLLYESVRLPAWSICVNHQIGFSGISSGPPMRSTAVLQFLFPTFFLSQATVWIEPRQIEIWADKTNYCPEKNITIFWHFFLTQKLRNTHFWNFFRCWTTVLFLHGSSCNDSAKCWYVFQIVAIVLVQKSTHCSLVFSSNVWVNFGWNFLVVVSSSDGHGSWKKSAGEGKKVS